MVSVSVETVLTNYEKTTHKIIYMCNGFIHLLMIIFVGMPLIVIAGTLHEKIFGIPEGGRWNNLVFLVFIVVAIVIYLFLLVSICSFF